MVSAELRHEDEGNERPLVYGSWRCKPLKMKKNASKLRKFECSINPSPIEGDDERGKQIWANSRLRSNLTAQILNK